MTGEPPQIQTPENAPVPEPRPADAKARILREAATRKLLFALGWVFLAIGAVGVVMPLLPGTVFLILAAWCFARSSPRFEAWLLNHRHLGPSVVRWKESGAIPRAAKVLAMSSFAVTLTGAWYLGAPRLMLIFLAALFAGLALFMLTRPSE